MKMRILVIASAWILLISCGGSGNPLTEASKTPECGQEIQTALAKFQGQMGLPFKMEANDYQTVFTTGMIDKDYFRDGMRMGASFRTQKRDARCMLQFYKRGKSGPGTNSSTYGDYGAIQLSSCHC